ncbi:MAG: hypothetical protein APF76_07250 [Desulfitibacter sp. BRH_c19]|nr:MAG: hypothetical protein APF76_07250 [Desulfitibacter sp. BRH_c19]
MSTNLYTINVNLKGRKCLVVGAGNISERKIQSLLECAANVSVVSPKFKTSILALQGHPNLTLITRPFEESDLNGMFLVISATNDRELNSKIGTICNNKNILINVVDKPEICSFFVPSILRRGDLSISISTGGKSPTLASKIKQDLSNQYGNEYERYVNILGEIRERIKTEVKDPVKRKDILNNLMEINLYELIKLHEDGLIKERIHKCISL